MLILFINLKELVSPERKFIREGVLVKMCRRVPKRRYFFLFNDLLIYGAANESTAKTTYTFHRSLNIKNLRVQDLPATDGMSHAFQLLSDQKSFAVFADSKESKQAWMDDIVYAKNYGKEVNLRQSQGIFGLLIKIIFYGKIKNSSFFKDLSKLILLLFGYLINW